MNTMVYHFEYVFCMFFLDYVQIQKLSCHAYHLVSQIVLGEILIYRWIPFVFFL